MPAVCANLLGYGGFRSSSHHICQNRLLATAIFTRLGLIEVVAHLRTIDLLPQGLSGYINRVNLFLVLLGLLPLVFILWIVNENLDLSTQNDVEPVTVVALSEYKFSSREELVPKLQTDVIQMVAFDVSLLEKLDLLDQRCKVKQVLLSPILWVLLQDLNHHLQDE